MPEEELTKANDLDDFDTILRMPTADVVPLNSGKWKET